MSGLIYYLPGTTRPQFKDVQAAGLGYAFDEGHVTPCGVQHGPGGTAGAVVADARQVHESLIKYYPDRQTWMKIPVSVAGAWVGCYKDDRPKPENLLSSSALPGHLITLGDGQDWLVPTALAWSGEEDRFVYTQRLPEAVGLDEQGQWISGGVLPAYAKLWEVATAWWEAVMASKLADDEENQTTINFDFAGSNDAALTVLAANYRLDKAEVVLLGLFNDQVVVNILQALIDWPGLLALKKKEELVGSSTDDGSQD